MTIDAMLTLARLKELQALERLRRALVLDAHDPDWTYVLSAMDARAHELRALLSRDDPQALRDCEQQLAEERAQAFSDAKVGIAEHLHDPQIVTGARIH